MNVSGPDPERMGGGCGGDDALALRGGSHLGGLCEEFRLGDWGRGPDLVGHDEVVAGAGACGDVGSAEEKAQRLAGVELGGGAALVAGVDGDDNVGAGNADGRDVAAFGDVCGNTIPKFGGANCEDKSRNLEGGAGVLVGGGVEYRGRRSGKCSRQSPLKRCQRGLPLRGPCLGPRGKV